MAIKVLSHYKSKIWLDDEETGEPQEVTLQVKRLAVDEFETFQAGLTRLNDPPSLRLLGGRLQTGAEQEKNERGRFVIPNEEITERRLKELDPAARAAYDAADAADETWAKRFVQESIEQYVSAPIGQIFNDDGLSVTTGADLVRLYCARADVLRAFLFAIHAENTLSASAKKVWRSVSDFTRSSIEPPKELRGATPAPIVGAAANEASAETGPATGSSDSAGPTPIDTPSSSGPPASSN